MYAFSSTRTDVFMGYKAVGAIPWRVTDRLEWTLGAVGLGIICWPVILNEYGPTTPSRGQKTVLL